MSAKEFDIAGCDPASEKQALEMAARAWPAAERHAYAQATELLIASGQADRVVLLSARHKKQLLAAQVAQMLSGRAAIAWPPQFDAQTTAEDRQKIAAAFGQRLAATLKQGGMHIAQSLLAYGDSENGQSLQSAGFSHAADLLYLTADVLEAPGAASELPFELETFTPGAKQRLVDVIQRTYIGTLDCPELDGLRDTADVIDGYQSVGQFRPELWFLVREKNCDVGCLLINMHPDVRHAEIVYLAVCLEVRGRGFGLLLAKHALWLAAQTSAERVVLAVDAGNEPAVGMYRTAGFDVFDRREVWLLTFPR